MARVNDEAAALLQELADLLSITGGEAYKVRAYEKAARAVSGHHEDVAKLGPDELKKIPNVGQAIAKKIQDYLTTGTMRQVEDLRTQIPAGVRALTTIPTLGPKTEENILHGITLMQQAGDRVLIDVAMAAAEEIVAGLSAVSGCRRCAYAGSLRRMRETIGDIDILAAATEPGPLMETFARLPDVAEVIAHGDKKTSIRTVKGLQIDLRVVPPESWGAALQYFTGSKAHNIRTREIAVRAGLKLSEYGLFDAESEKLIVPATEEEVYERLGLPWNPPTLRVDGGQIPAALG